MAYRDDPDAHGENAFQAPQIPDSFTVPAHNLPALQDKIAKLNRRAKRLGCAPIVLNIGPAFVAEKSQLVVETSYMMAKTRNIRVKCHTVTVTGTRPQLPGGWSLVARVQLLEATTILHTVPGETVPREYHSVGNQCDHCGINRARNDVFVLRNNDAKHIVVGRTCIADFLGGISPAQLAWFAESLHALDLREFESYGGYSASQMDTEKYITAAACAIRVGGWLSKKAVEISGGGYSTADMASDLYHGRLRRDSDDKVTTAEFTRYGSVNPRIEITPEDETEGQSAIAWAQAIDPETANDYLINCHKVADLTFAPWNLSGIAASIVSAYQREQGRLATKDYARKVSQHVGTIGERLTLTLTVERIYSIEGRYGVTAIHTMRDTAGNVVKWFASKESLHEGDTYTVTGTVKGHGEYKGTAETTLTRCRATRVQCTAARCGAAPREY